MGAIEGPTGAFLLPAAPQGIIGAAKLDGRLTRKRLRSPTRVRAAERGYDGGG